MPKKKEEQQRQQRKRRVRKEKGLTKAQVEVLAATRRALTQKVWVSLEDIKEEIEAERNAKEPVDARPVTVRQISRVFTGIRDFYPDDPEKIIITFRAGLNSRYQLNGRSFVTRLDTGLILYTICTLCMHQDEGITRKDLLLQLKDRIIERQLNDRLAWASDKNKADYITIDEDNRISPTPRAFQELGYFAALKKESGMPLPVKQAL